MYHNPTKKINKARFNAIFTKLWAKSLIPENIISGFRATGLFPFDPNAIPEDAYAPSLLTENQNPLTPITAASTSTHAMVSAGTPDSGLNVQGYMVNDTHMEVTDAEDSVAKMESRNYVTSPSLLNSLQEITSRGVAPSVLPISVVSDGFLQRRLVDYSSSLDTAHKHNVTNKEKNTDLNEKWFCHGCKLEREEDMRRCRKCFKWYHEECVGLTKDDDEDFICPNCV